MLDVEFYISQLDQEARSLKGENQTWLEYFLEHNLQDQKSPSIHFSSERYINRYPDISQQGLNPLFHYVAHGEKGGREKFNDWSVRSPLFDERAYLDNNDDIRISRIDPWRHYCEHGHKENRNPNPVFHVAFYRQKYLPDQPNVDPLVHYESQSGRLMDTHPCLTRHFIFRKSTLLSTKWSNKVSAHLSTFSSTTVKILLHRLRCFRQDVISKNTLILLLAKPILCTTFWLTVSSVGGSRSWTWKILSCLSFVRSMKSS